MTKQARSVRLSDQHHRFLNQSSFDFAEEVREWLDEKSVSYAAGVCAACGEVVFVGGHAVVSGSAPAGKSLGLSYTETIDLCDPCWESASDSLMESDEENGFELSYLVSRSEYLIYRAERDAVIDAHPDSAWSPLVTRRDGLTKPDVIELVYEWVKTADLADVYAESSIEPDAVYDAVGAELERWGKIETDGDEDE
jgi:hypothetical protein